MIRIKVHLEGEGIKNTNRAETIEINTRNMIRIEENMIRIREIMRWRVRGAGTEDRRKMRDSRDSEAIIDVISRGIHRKGEIEGDQSHQQQRRRRRDSRENRDGIVRVDQKVRKSTGISE